MTSNDGGAVVGRAEACVVTGLRGDLGEPYCLQFSFRGKQYRLVPNPGARSATPRGAPATESRWEVHGKQGCVASFPGGLDDLDDPEDLSARVESCLLTSEGHDLATLFDAVCREVALAALQGNEDLVLEPVAETFTLRTPGFVAGSYFAVRVQPHCLVNGSPRDLARAFLETYRRHRV